jgi:hypothetical protein
MSEELEIDIVSLEAPTVARQSAQSSAFTHTGRTAGKVLQTLHRRIPRNLARNSPPGMQPRRVLLTRHSVGANLRRLEVRPLLLVVR